MSPAGNCTNRHDKGMTLLETLIVISVLALVATLAVPRLHGRLISSAFGVEADNIVRVLNETRRYARLTGMPTRARMQLSSRQLIGVNDAVAEWSAETDVELVAAQSLMSPNGVEWVFYPDGSASGGTITLIGLNRKRQQIVIDWLTGVHRSDD